MTCRALIAFSIALVPAYPDTPDSCLFTYNYCRGRDAQYLYDNPSTTKLIHFHLLPAEFTY